MNAVVVDHGYGDDGCGNVNTSGGVGSGCPCHGGEGGDPP